VGADRLLVSKAAVGEANRGDALDLLEVELDQRLPRVVVPGPGEGQAGRGVDLGVMAAAAVLDAIVRVGPGADPAVLGAGIVRTARKLMDGMVFPRA